MPEAYSQSIASSAISVSQMLRSDIIQLVNYCPGGTPLWPCLSTVLSAKLLPLFKVVNPPSNC